MFLNLSSLKTGDRSRRREMKKRHHNLTSPCLSVCGLLGFGNNIYAVLVENLGGEQLGEKSTQRL